MQMEDVNFSLEYVVCRDAERLRVIPLGGKSKRSTEILSERSKRQAALRKKKELSVCELSGKFDEQTGILEKSKKSMQGKPGLKKILRRTPSVTVLRHIWWKTEPTFAMCRRCWATRTSRQRRSIWRWQQEKSELPIRRHIRGQINAWMSHKQKVTDSNGYRKLF